MGIEAFVVSLTPKRANHSVLDVDREIKNLGFYSVPLELDYGPNLDRTEYLMANDFQIIEAQVKQNEDKSLFCLNIRVAVCQPRTVWKTYFDIIYTLCDRFDLEVTCDYRTMFDKSDFNEFRLEAEKQLVEMKRGWQVLFRGDTEEPILRCGHAIRYFTKKHRM